MTPLNIVIGGRELCAWQPVAGITWVQTRSATHNRRLSQRCDGRLIVRGVAGGYLRTYEFHHSLAWAARLIARYTRDEMPTNAAKNRLAASTPPLAAHRADHHEDSRQSKRAVLIVS